MSSLERQARYARTADGLYLGYQVIGEGELDLVWQPDWPGNMDMDWEYRFVRAHLEAFASFGRLIGHDHRGIGISSRNVPIPNLETRVADLLVVLDTVGASRPALVGWGSSASVHALLASSRPERVAALVSMDPSKRTAWALDYVWGRTPEQRSREFEDLRAWGTEEYARVFIHDLAEQGTTMPADEASRSPVRRGSHARQTSRPSSPRCGRRPMSATSSRRSPSRRSSCRTRPSAIGRRRGTLPAVSPAPSSWNWKASRSAPP
jgi:pimeloyl-ACP methyl ester carboxylesterase